uniref:Transposable element P transposase-like RNase H domain-containing protein n=3 Tax=Amphimedon queenslandica TaxID=400682 RepID=A0A1X7V4D4_AMPQE
MQSSSKHYRWHPAVIKISIFLSHKSSKAYKLLCKTNGITLPSQRTLRDYTHAFKSSVEFSSNLDNQLIKSSNVNILQPHQKHITLIGDEMFVKAGLVYKHSGELIGFSDLGDINNHLLQLEHEYKNPATANKGPKFASTVMTIMIRGLFTSFAFPYVSFLTYTVMGEQSNTHEVFLFSAWNCLANPKRNLQLNGKSISWEHIKQLHSLVTETKRLSTVHKLKFENIYLTGFSKMRVDLAAEWLKELLVWLKNWEEQAKRRTDLRKSERNKLILSSETLFGVRLTVYSFSDLIKYIFTIPSVKSFLSEHISQDPLEKFCGEHRQRGQTNESQTVDQFLQNSQTLRVFGSIKIDTAKGNTRGTKTDNISAVQYQRLILSHQNLIPYQVCLDSRRVCYCID